MFLPNSYFKILIIAACLLLFPFLVLGLFAVADADTLYYSRAQYNEYNQNFIQTQSEFYTRWSGRYTSTFLMVGLPQLLEPNTMAKIIIVLSIPLLVLALWGLFEVIHHKHADHVIKLAMSVVVVLLFLTLMPGYGDGLYWFAGNINYFFSLSLIVGLLILGYSHFNSPNPYKFLCLVVFIVLSSGTNELVSIDMVLFFFCMQVVNYLKTRKISASLLLLFLISLGSFLIVLASPGNTTRAMQTMAENPGIRPDLIICMVVSLGYLCSYLVTWLMSPVFWVTSLILMLCFQRLGKYIPIRIGGLSPRILILIAGLVMMANYTVVEYFFSHATYYPVRTINVTLFICLLAWVFLLSKIDLPSSWSERLWRGKWLLIIMVSVFAVSPNFIYVVNDLVSGQAANYAQYWSQINATLAGCEKRRQSECDITINTSTPISPILNTLDIRLGYVQWVYGRVYSTKIILNTN